MNLAYYCQNNNYCCGTCIQSYKNYISKDKYNMFCGCGGHIVNEKSVCIDYTSKE
jgi:hypothetical protein